MGQKGRGPYVVSLVGGGGKTSLIRRLAWEGVRLGLKVLVATTTHMAMPSRLGVCSGSREDVEGMLERERAAVVGRADGKGKISYMGDAQYEALCPMAHLVLIEADGAKRLPLKAPGVGEPVIPGNTDMILCVSGLTAVGGLAGDKCFRLEAALGVMEAHGRKGFRKAQEAGEGKADAEDGSWRITLEDMGCLMRFGYLEPLRAACPGAAVIPVFNQADTRGLALEAGRILDEMTERKGIVSGGLLLEASAGLF